jgi:hypothetical protein
MSIGRVYRAIGVAFFEVEIQLLQSEILPNVELGRAVCLPATCWIFVAEKPVHHQQRSPGRHNRYIKAPNSNQRSSAGTASTPDKGKSGAFAYGSWFPNKQRRLVFLPYSSFQLIRVSGGWGGATTASQAASWPNESILTRPQH